MHFVLVIRHNNGEVTEQPYEDREVAEKVRDAVVDLTTRFSEWEGTTAEVREEADETGPGDGSGML